MHHSWVNKCSPSMPNDFYWYGGKWSKPGRPPVLRDTQKHSEGDDLDDNEDQSTNNAQDNLRSTRKKRKPRRSKITTSATLNVHCPYNLNGVENLKVHYLVDNARDELDEGGDDVDAWLSADSYIMRLTINNDIEITNNIIKVISQLNTGYIMLYSNCLSCSWSTKIIMWNETMNYSLSN